MFATQKNYYAREKYLELEGQAIEKSEYHQGEIVAMAGASWKHSQISGNVFRIIGNALEDKPCHVSMSDIKLWIEQRDCYTYPDVMVICGEPDFAAGRTDTVTNPVLIIEVLSKSTAEYDRTDKFHASWTLASLQEYVLIDQYRIRVEYFRRIDEQTWELRVLTKLEDRLLLKSIEVELELSQIYRQVKWEETS